MRSSVRYSIAVYAGLLLAGSIVVPPPTPSRGAGSVPAIDFLFDRDAVRGNETDYRQPLPPDMQRDTHTVGGTVPPRSGNP